MLLAPNAQAASKKKVAGLVTAITGGVMMIVGLEEKCPSGYSTHTFQNLPTQCVFIGGSGSDVREAGLSISHSGAFWGGVGVATTGIVMMLLPEPARVDIAFSPHGLLISKTIRFGYYTLDLTDAFVHPFTMMKRHKAPGKAHREGITVVQLMDMFPNETAARQWFEQMFWNGERSCGHCGSLSTSEVPNEKPMPYWCGGCRSYFSVRTGTVLERSHVPLRKWVIAIYLELTSLKSVSSIKLHRDIGVRQATAWFMLHRIREAWKVLGGTCQQL